MAIAFNHRKGTHSVTFDDLKPVVYNIPCGGSDLDCLLKLFLRACRRSSGCANKQA